MKFAKTSVEKLQITGKHAVVLLKTCSKVFCDAAIERLVGALKQVYMPSLLRRTILPTHATLVCYGYTHQSAR